MTKNDSEEAEVLRVLLADPSKPHTVLNVPADATKDAVRQAYLDLARRTHPDKCSHARAAEAFQVVGRALEALSGGQPAAAAAARDPTTAPDDGITPEAREYFMRYLTMEAEMKAANDAKTAAQREAQEERTAARRAADKERQRALVDSLGSKWGLKRTGNAKGKQEGQPTPCAAWNNMFDPSLRAATTIEAATAEEQPAAALDQEAAAERDAAAESFAKMEAVMKQLSGGGGSIVRAAPSAAPAAATHKTAAWAPSRKQKGISFVRGDALDAEKVRC